MTRPVEVSDAHHAWLVAEAKRRGCTPAEVLQQIVEVEAYVAPPPRDPVGAWLQALLVVLLVGAVVLVGRWQW